jgi:galacturan 1,4-alpha-galacturonidase
MIRKKPPLMEKKSEESLQKASASGPPLPLKIAYIGGGSRGWAHILIKDLLQYPGFTGEVRLYDIDKPMAELNARFASWMQSHPDAVSRWKYRVVDSLKAALKGADFVFVSIQPGPVQLMKVDLEEPAKYGIFQSVGDTVGPGGCIRALRAIREYRVIAQDIARYAPNAWTLSFTNPMSVCTRTLYETFPDIKAWGCCHEVFGTKRMLRDVYVSMTDEEKPQLCEIDVNVLGVNHFTWIDRATCRGTDLLALLKEYMARPGVVRKYSKEEVEGRDNVFIDHDQVKFELYRRFGVLAAAGDRHLAEFVPWFLTDRDSCYRWGFMLTPYSYRLKRYRQAPKQFQKMLEKGQFPPLLTSGEEYLNQMMAVTGQGVLKTNVNLPNRGQVQGLPTGAVVETNAVFSENSVEPVASGQLPDNVNVLVLRHVFNQESLIEAVFTEDKDLAFQAFLNDPLVTISVDEAWRLFNTMLKKTERSNPFFPQ